MDARALNDEVLVANGPLVQLGDDDIAELKRLSTAAPRRRVRICAHPDTGDRLHEMLIVHTAGAYVRPHKHPGKSESVHAIEGEADIVFFDEDGGIREVVKLGPFGSGRRFYYRLDDEVFHTLRFRSEFFVMHEVTNGPFRREDTVFAPWAPEEEDVEAREAFCRDVDERIAGAAA
jgi:cupin fold WbuC family metalloprotein